jgi:hypothetical protein
MHIPIYLLKNGKSIVAKATVCLNVGPSLVMGHSQTTIFTPTESYFDVKTKYFGDNPTNMHVSSIHYLRRWIECVFVGFY